MTNRAFESLRGTNRWRLGWLLGVVLTALIASESIAAGRGDLGQQIERLLARGPLAKADVGILVERAGDRRTLYSRGADRLLIPASNQKVLTALAALNRFGPTHRFATRVWSPTPLTSEGVVPELVVEGGGDPAMNSEDWWRLAADLRKTGLRGVAGSIRVDDDLFDGPGWHPSWGRISARAYHAPVGALTANYGHFNVLITPRAKAGDGADVYIDPPVDYLRLNNKATTGSRRAKQGLRVDRIQGARSETGSGEEIVRVQGVVRVGDGIDDVPRSVLDPGLYAGSLLALQLESNGIFVNGDVRRQPRLDPKAKLLLEREGRTLAEIVSLCMKYSNNAMAESLVKSLGAALGESAEPDSARQGDWVSGVRALRAELASLGVRLGEATFVDGSGLSIQNRVMPRTLVDALQAGRESFRVGPEFMAALPISERDGTLKKRIKGSAGRIRAKTGLLGDARVSSLSGFAERTDGETLVFSILVNGYSGNAGDAMNAVDAIATTLLSAPLPAQNAAN